VLGGALSGTGCTTPGRRIANGMFSLYIDPAQVDPEGMFSDDVLRFIDFVKQAKPAPPATETMVPGEPELRSRSQRLRDGVPLPEETWRSLLEAAKLTGLDAKWIQETSAHARRPHA
jgi:uncharacterized oxidoreductase